MKDIANKNDVEAYESQHNFGNAEKLYARKAVYIMLIAITILFALFWIL